MENWTLWTALIAYSLLHAFCAAEDTCKTSYQGGCLKKIHIKFEEKIVTDKREFTIYYREAADKTEVIAECDWLSFGRFKCIEKEGFNCDEEMKTDFSIEINDTIRCLHTGELQLDVAQEGIMRCDLSLNQIKVPDSHIRDVEREVAEGSCKMDYESGCLKRMSIQFQERIVTEKREFTIYYKETEDKKEVIADCFWRSGKFTCEKEEGFTCDEELRTNFSIVIRHTTRCIHTGKFLMDVAHEESLTCSVLPHQIEMKPSESQLNDKKQEEGKINVTGVVTGVIVSCFVVIGIGVSVYILKKRGVFSKLKTKQKSYKENRVKDRTSPLPLIEPVTDQVPLTFTDVPTNKPSLRKVKPQFPSSQVAAEKSKENTGSDTKYDHRDVYPSSASDEDKLQPSQKT